METSEQSPIPEPPWKRAARDRAPRTPLTQRAIVDAALRVLKRHGSDGLSMRRVADELGTGPASLYWHVANREELVNLLIDRVASEIPLPSPDPDHWQRQLTDWVLEAREAFKRYPGVAGLTLGRIPVGPTLVRWSEWGLALLRGAGVPDRIAAYSFDLLGLYLGATSYEEGMPPPAPSGKPLGMEELAQMIRGYFESLPKEQFPNVHATLDEMFSGGPEERFRLGLDVIVRGLASYIER